MGKYPNNHKIIRSEHSEAITIQLLDTSITHKIYKKRISENRIYINVSVQPTIEYTKDKNGPQMVYNPDIKLMGLDKN